MGILYSRRSRPRRLLSYALFVAAAALLTKARAVETNYYTGARAGWYVSLNLSGTDTNAFLGGSWQKSEAGHDNYRVFEVSNVIVRASGAVSIPFAPGIRFTGSHTYGRTDLLGRLTIDDGPHRRTVRMRLYAQLLPLKPGAYVGTTTLNGYHFYFTYSPVTGYAGQVAFPFQLWEGGLLATSQNLAVFTNGLVRFSLRKMDMDETRIDDVTFQGWRSADGEAISGGVSVVSRSLGLRSDFVQTHRANMELRRRDL